jgi:hypothetical protein
MAPFHPDGGCSKYPEETELLASSEGLRLVFKRQTGVSRGQRRGPVSWSWRTARMARAQWMLIRFDFMNAIGGTLGMSRGYADCGAA